MLPVILFLICIIASSVGAIVGAGGGVIIKPVMDMLGLLPVSTAGTRRCVRRTFGSVAV